MKKIALALGGGGSRGNAHIGVLRVLENAGYEITAVAGTSFGGLVAAFYAAGYSPDEIEDLFSSIDQSKMYELGLHAKPGILGLGKIHLWLDEHLGDKTFAETRIPCALTAADLNCNCEVTLQEGALKDAILGSIAVPGVFPPHKVDGHYLVDGGVLNPVPVSVARQLAPKLPVIAVPLTMPVLPASSYHVQVALPSVIPESIVQRITRLNVAQAMDVFLHSIDMGYRAITELRLEKEPPTYVIRPPLESIGLLDQVDVRAVAKIGAEETEAALPEIKKAIRRSQGIFEIIFGRD